MILSGQAAAINAPGPVLFEYPVPRFGHLNFDIGVYFVFRISYFVLRIFIVTRPSRNRNEPRNPNRLTHPSLFCHDRVLPWKDDASWGQRGTPLLVLNIRSFVLWICFGFRISCFVLNLFGYFYLVIGSCLYIVSCLP
jgi:hypothetical protein